MALLLALFFGGDAFSYIGTSCGWIKDTVKSSVPVEFEIQRAHDEVEKLVPAIRQNMHLIAKEEIEVERLQEQIADSESRLTEDRSDIDRLTGDLRTGQDHFYYASRRYSRDQVKVDLANRFGRYKTAEGTLASLKQIHEARTRSLEAARQKLEAMLSQKTQLAAEVANLEAQLKTLEVAKATSDYNFDDSQLGRVKGIIAEIKERLDVEARLINAEGYFQDEIPLDQEKKASEDIVDQVTAYFSSGETVEVETTQVAERESETVH